MLISKYININRLVQGTWKNAFFILLTCVTSYAIDAYLIKGAFSIPALLPSILGTALSFFIGFNNNQAYDRWWEARKIWGALVNDSRTWARQIFHYLKSSESINENEIIQVKNQMVRNHIAFLYALKENLRNESNKDYLLHLKDEDKATVEKEGNKANAIIGLNNIELSKVYEAKAIDGFKFMALNNMLVNFCDEMGKSERIKNTVFPTTYSYYTKVFIWIFIISATLTMAPSLGLWSILISLLIGYVFLTTYKLGETLVNPFEDIPSGVSIMQLTRTIEINMLETIQEENTPPPIKSVNNEYIM